VRTTITLLLLILPNFAFGQFFLNSSAPIARETKEKISALLASHAKLTDETIGIEFTEKGTPNTPLSERFFSWAPKTKKPTNSILIRIEKDTDQFEIFSGAGFSALLGTEGIDRIHDQVASQQENSKNLDSRSLTIVKIILLQIESPIEQSLSGITLSAGLKSPVLTSDAPTLSWATLWGTFLVLLLVSAGALYRILFSEIHLGAFFEKRVSPFQGKFRRANLEEDLITGGGVSGHWDS
jgi:hypothetical protein